MMSRLVSFLLGALMAAGFVVAGVTRPETITSFLHITGDWQHDVLLVMAAAVTVTFVLYRLAWRRGAPLLGGRFLLPTRRDIDRRLVIGAALFGAGWGITGLCPGPALASLSTGSPLVLLFLGTMTLGMLLHKRMEVWLSRRARDASSAREADGPHREAPDIAGAARPSEVLR